MGLPWFAFSIKDFLANTGRLNTEATGAYLLLMLDYYEQEEPPPDDPEVLATITGLTDDVWRRHERVIRPLFEIRNGRWHHERIEAEIEKGRARHANAIRGLGSAAAAVKKRKRGGESAPAEPKPTPKPPIPGEMPVAAPVMEPEPEPSLATHKQEHSIEVVSNDTTARAPDALIPEDFSLTGMQIIGYQNDGYSSEDIAGVLDLFKRYHGAAGTFSNDWTASWDRWWERKKPALVEKAKPRIEVSRKIAKAIPEEWMPNAGHYELAHELTLNCRAIEDTFRDYCASSGKKYIDHDAAFRNFLRNQSTFNRGTTNGKAPGPDRSITGASQRLDGAIDSRIAALEAHQPDGDDPV